MPLQWSDNQNKPRGRLTPYAFFVQICREEHKRKYPEEKVDFSEFSRKCADRWKTMSDLEKKRFNMLADNDKRRYEYEVSLFNNSKAETGKAKGKVKKLKDPNAPKRPMSAYFIFMNATRDSVKAKNPGISTGDCSKVIGKMWAEMEPREKEKYDVLAAEAKEKYEGEKAAYDAKQTGGHGEVEEEEDMEEESD